MHLISQQLSPAVHCKDDGASLIHNNNNNNNKSKQNCSSFAGGAGGTALRMFLIDIPLVTLFAILVASVLVQHLYLTYVTPMVQSHTRGPMGDFYDDYKGDFTYYNRQCDASDISTTSSSDLLIHEDYTGRQAADVMLKHGAVAFRNVLNNQTASDLRAYLASRHKIKDKLGWNEKFWESQNRLSLGLGISDHPSIAEALQQVGTHPVVKRTLEGILGPDPAIVEISTLTTLHGADNQGIHSDSDWFGSSLLYSRTFLHSYSFFVALQDTSKELGATTVCPGTHFCADQDLEDVCLNNGAFEVSSNGFTGDEGLLAKGDAFLFNQNVWHRGPTNRKVETDRIMFILTFVSRNSKETTPSDHRSQALGTYYYQRWNMWGHTFNDLKDAAKTMMQPFGALRALGLWKPKGRHWGITWIEQFSRQLANGEDFYDEYVLEEFVEMLNDMGVPTFLRSQSTEWEQFIPETMALWVKLLAWTNVAVVGVYVMVRLLARWCLSGRNDATTKHRRRHSIPLFLKRLVHMHGCICLVAYALLCYIDQTELAESTKSGEIFVKPFAPTDPGRDGDGPMTMTTTPSLGPTTFPERNDVLIGTRFDAEFLASYNRFLDFHPGNERWRVMVADAARLPPVLQGPAIRTIVKTIKEEGGGRILLQDPVSGAWTVLSESDAFQETARAVLMKRDRLVEALGTHLAHVLAEARFGVMRDTSMARRFTPQFVEQWKRLVFAAAEQEDGTTSTAYCRPQGPERCRSSSRRTGLGGFVLVPPSWRDSNMKANDRKTCYVKHSIHRRAATDKDNTVQVGDRIFGNYNGNGWWFEAKILEIYDDSTCRVAYTDGDYEMLSVENIRKYEPFVEGDIVEAYHHGGEWLTGRIANVHPDGTCSVMYEDRDELVTGLKRDDIRKLVASTVSLNTDVVPLVAGDRIIGNFRENGEWFDGQVMDVNADGTFEILYDDGDEESGVLPQSIRRLS